MGIEILAPAGSPEGLDAVLQAGADAVYLGSGGFNARTDAAQFASEDLPEIGRRIRRHGAKFYYTLNILLRDDELEAALKTAHKALEAGADALIVQDRGLMRRLRQAFPEVPIHASTQCTAGSEEALEAYRELGAGRVILPRELSLRQIEALSEHAGRIGMETEVFVHGALCMSVSGQCLMSRFMGGRSANRGECAQCCRQDYENLKDGRPFRETAAWLSPRDISAFEILDKLLACGVSALKIEGRLRRPDYAAQTCAVFRNALDELEAGKAASEVLSPERLRDLLLAFNRGGSFNKAYFLNQRDRHFLSAKRSGHYGLYLGKVSALLPHEGLVRIEKSPELPADYCPREQSQIALRPDPEAEGVSAPCGVIRLARDQKTLELKGFHPKILRELKGQTLYAWQMDQPLTDDLQNTDAPGETLDMRLFRNEEGKISLALKSRKKSLLFTEDDLKAEPLCIERPLPAARCRTQLAKVGNTPYEAGRILIEAEPPWRVRDLNALRREALEAFAALKPEKDRSLKAPGPAALAAGEKEEDAGLRERFRTAPVFKRLVFLPFWRGGALPAVFKSYKALYILPLSDVLKAGSEGLFRAAENTAPGSAFAVFLPPLLPEKLADDAWQKLREIHTRFPLEALASGPSGLPRQAEKAGLGALACLALQGSQIWNRETIRALALEGFDHFLLSPELSGEETKSLYEHLSSPYKERVLLWHYGRTRAMFTRFCPLGFSRGYAQCRLCEKGAYALRDARGRCFPAAPRPHLDCSFELYQSEPLEPSRLPRTLEDGEAGRFMLFSDEKENEIARIIGL